MASADSPGPFSKFGSLFFPLSGSCPLWDYVTHRKLGFVAVSSPSWVLWGRPRRRCVSSLGWNFRKSLRAAPVGKKIAAVAQLAVAHSYPLFVPLFQLVGGTLCSLFCILARFFWFLVFAPFFVSNVPTCIGSSNLYWKVEFVLEGLSCT